MLKGNTNVESVLNHQNLQNSFEGKLGCTKITASISGISEIAADEFEEAEQKNERKRGNSK